MGNCDDVAALAQELGVTRQYLYKWRRKLETIEPREEASRPGTRVASRRRENGRLKRLLAENTLEVDFFKGVLQKIEARRRSRGDSGATASTSRSAT